MPPQGPSCRRCPRERRPENVPLREAHLGGASSSSAIEPHCRTLGAMPGKYRELRSLRRALVPPTISPRLTVEAAIALSPWQRPASGARASGFAGLRPLAPDPARRPQGGATAAPTIRLPPGIVWAPGEGGTCPLHLSAVIDRRATSAGRTDRDDTILRHSGWGSVSGRQGCGGAPAGRLAGYGRRATSDARLQALCRPAARSASCVLRPSGGPVRPLSRAAC